MELFFAEHWEVVTGFIMILLTVIGFLLKSSLNSNKVSEKEVKQKLEEVEKDIKEVKENYLDRFERVFAKLTQISIDIEKLHGMLESQRQICEFVQKSKVNHNG